MLRGKGFHGPLQRERLGAFASGQQQSKGHGLGVSVGKLLIGGPRKQELPPVFRQRHQGGALVLDRLHHIVAQQAAQRR